MTVAGGGGVPSRVTVIVYVWVVPSSAVTVKERVFGPEVEVEVRGVRRGGVVCRR